jgi:hypothetical protein
MSVKADPLDIGSLFERKLLSPPGGHGILKIVLFCSHAKGAAQPESDIDMLVVAGRESESREAVADAAFEAQMRSLRRGSGGLPLMPPGTPPNWQ